MKFRTFRIIGLLVVIGVFVSAGAGIKYLLNQRPTEATTAEAAPVAPPTERNPPIPTSAPEQLSTDAIRGQVEAWIEAHPDRQSRMKLVNFLPMAPFRATAIRFPESDASRWTSNPNDWNQIRLDLDRDGTDDEKWLLKDGHTYKRETLDRNGKTISSEHFK